MGFDLQTSSGHLRPALFPPIKLYKAALLNVPLFHLRLGRQQMRDQIIFLAILKSKIQLGDTQSPYLSTINDPGGGRI